MRYLPSILYGIVIGNWLMNVHRRLHPGIVPGRYAIIAENCMLNGYFVLIGYCDTLGQASAVNEVVEDSATYIGHIYDKMTPGDNEFITRVDFIPWNELIQADRDDLKPARLLCERHG